MTSGCQVFQEVLPSRPWRRGRRPARGADELLMRAWWRLYADQPHFNREIRTMTGITPAELFAFLQDNDRHAD